MAHIHLIAIGGSAMHNLALALRANGHHVSGSDDEIYDPARSRLAAAGLLPETFGWDAGRIHAGLDMVIVGMHARPDNPELLAAQALGLPLHSYPSFIRQHAEGKTRVVVAGSHGKTTTTAMIMHALRGAGLDFDYLVGAQLDGFEHMVRLSAAPIMVIEGDEYLSAPNDPQPKMLHYEPHIAILTGIAWDHINVFPSEAAYVDVFRRFVGQLGAGALLIAYADDAHIERLLAEGQVAAKVSRYRPAELRPGPDGQPRLWPSGTPLRVFGAHNLANLAAAWQACAALGLDDARFLAHIQHFEGAAKRLQTLHDSPDLLIVQDFAHAPSKVRASVAAMRERYPERQLVACLELHTFSSLNRDFHPQYAGSLAAADRAIVFVDAHTLAMKRMPPIATEALALDFQRPDLEVYGHASDLAAALQWRDTARPVALLLMSSGRWGGMDPKALVPKS